jgi:hypothetical protein
MGVLKERLRSYSRLNFLLRDSSFHLHNRSERCRRTSINILMMVFPVDR